MDPKYVVADLPAALDKRLFPTVTVWNRLEGRPRADNFDRALRAEVRDPLWMLSKQWQLGEFAADDAGSPVFTKVRMRTSPVTKYRPGSAATEPFEAGVPMEAKAERRTVQWVVAGHKAHLDLRAQLGRQWDNLLRAAGLTGYRPQYLTRYAFTLPAQDETTDYVYAHRLAWQQYAALAGRCVDGGELYLYLSADPAHRASDGVTVNTTADGDALDGLGVELLRWFAGLYYQPAHEDAWQPSYLEYQFACSAPRNSAEQVLVADGYASGHLDWYSFDRADGDLGGPVDPGEEVTVNSYLPTPVTFDGMPDARWWALEDRKTDFGAVRPSTTDVAQLLLMEFALVYADDWLLIPFRLPAGTLARVDGMAVTNTFGERYWILPAGTGTEQNWHRWAMFQLHSGTPDTRGVADPSLFIPPAVGNTLDGDPVEDVELARDEVANMVWAIERTVPSVTGAGSPGRDEARETRQYHERLVAAGTLPPVDYRADIAYLAMTGVPEHFIPFLPVHVPGSNREVQLQRGRMLRIIDRDPLPPEKIPPRTTLIRQGLDEPVKQPYFLHEEEVPRAGIRVSQAFRRTRWTGGQAYVWLGVRKQTGRGERASGLAFDSIVDAKPRDNA
jgi:hypothetical protein